MGIYPLAARQTQIADLIAKGLSNKAIGYTLSISEQTVKNHIAVIFRKTGCINRVQIAVLAVRGGLQSDA